MDDLKDQLHKEGEDWIKQHIWPILAILITVAGIFILLALAK